MTAAMVLDFLISRGDDGASYLDISHAMGMSDRWARETVRRLEGMRLKSVKIKRELFHNGKNGGDVLVTAYPKGK